MSGRPREFEREKALERAMEVFWDRGFEGTGMSELVKRTGVAKQSLYNTFGNKKALFRAALEHYSWTRHRVILETLRAQGSALGNIERVLRMWQEKAQSADCSGCLIINSVTEIGSEDPALAQWLAEQIEAIESAFLQALNRARAAGELRPDLELRPLARFLASVGQSLGVLGKLPLSPDFSGDVVEMTLAFLSMEGPETKSPRKG